MGSEDVKRAEAEATIRELQMEILEAGGEATMKVVDERKLIFIKYWIGVHNQSVIEVDVLFPRGGKMCSPVFGSYTFQGKTVFPCVLYQRLHVRGTPSLCMLWQTC